MFAKEEAQKYNIEKFTKEADAKVKEAEEYVKSGRPLLECDEEYFDKLDRLVKE